LEIQRPSLSGVIPKARVFTRGLRDIPHALRNSGPTALLLESRAPGASGARVEAEPATTAFFRLFPAVIYCSFRRRNPLRFLDRLQPLALLAMRLTLGAIMATHGYHKVFGGLHHDVQFVASLGLPGWTAYLSAFTEFLGGLLVLAGLFTRCAAFAICIDLGVAIAKVHLHNGLTGNGGYEFTLAVATLAFGLIFFGGGPIAFDHIRASGGGGKSK
jgi:putative oxidoreductase